MKKIILLMMIVLLFVPLVNADLGIYKQGDTISVRGNLNATSVNVTIYFPNSTIAVDNQAMGNLRGDIWNYNFSNTATLGKYIYDYCDQNGNNCKENLFIITPIGLSQTTSQGIGSAVFLILMLVLMFVFGFLGFRLLKTENWWILGIFLIFLSSLFLVYNTWLGYEYHRLFTGLPDSGMPETIFWIFLALISAGILASAILLFRHWKKVIRYLKKEMKRKDSEDTGLEDFDLENWTGEEWGPPKGFK